WFASEGINAVGFGWVAMLRTRAPSPLPLARGAGAIAPPVGRAEGGGGRGCSDAVRWLRDGAMLYHVCVQAAQLVEETRGPVGAEDPESIVLRLQQGVRRARQVDTVEAGLV